MATVGELIRDGRKARGMTQHQLALAIGVQNQIVSNWERGAMIEAKNFARLVSVLGLDETEAWMAYARLVNASIVDGL
jgi:transcriptional regulator with XRE-family HTH domain